MRAAKPYNLAIETSGRAGSVSLGRGDTLLATEQVGQRRHAVGLMPAIDRLFTAHEVGRHELGEVYVSIGPGSFTGLRIGVTTAKVFARVLGSKIVAVETLSVVAQNAADDLARAAVCLNAKRGRYFAGLFERDAAGLMRPTGPTGLWTMAEVLERAGRPITVLGDKLERLESPGVTYAEGDAARARGEVTWLLGRELARKNEFTDAAALTPKYVRLPEAEEVWRNRHDQPSSP